METNIDSQETFTSWSRERSTEELRSFVTSRLAILTDDIDLELT